MKKEEQQRYRELLAALNLGLEDRMSTKVGLLSGGQRQSLTLLMAVLKNPKLLLLDEHTAALDPRTAQKVLEITEQLVSTRRLTTLMITHNMRDALHLGDRLIMMDGGRIVLDIAGEEKKNLTVSDLLVRFSAAAGKDEVSDKLLLSK
jgi:putative ABC transport system ATP-binding protein